MSSKPLRGLRRLCLALVLGAACRSGESLDAPGLVPPATVSATAINLATVRLDWASVAGADLQTVRIQRRTNLKGRFETIAEVDAASTTYFDAGLTAGTFYGYRIVVVNRLGETSRPSVVAGALTPPPPGLLLQTSLQGTPEALADPNGYRLTIHGPRDTTLAVGPSEQRVLAPLPAGSYSVTLSDLAPTCTLVGDSVRVAEVRDTGVVTRTPVAFTASCTDPSRGGLVAVVTVVGDSVDADGYRLDYAGIIPGDSVPAVGGGTVAGTGGAQVFAGLRPGDYEVSLSDVEVPCLVSGAASQGAQVAALAVDTVRFQVTCPNKQGGGNTNAPFVVRNTWSPPQAGSGQTVALDVAVDMTAVPGAPLGAIQAELQYNSAVLTFAGSSSPAPAQMNNLTVNAGTPGVISWGNFTTSATAPTGLVAVARFTFTVNAASGQSATRTANILAADADFAEIADTLLRVVEDTFQVGSGGGGANQAPIAEANGPYSGAVGGAIAFSASGSRDPDGSIASYRWAFSDGVTSTQASPSRSFATAGNYTVTLTVTDNQGATATDQASITIGGGGGGNLPPVAEANGPYSGTAGSPISLSSAGSSDPDGSIASYSWSFSDGTTSTQANPAKSFTSAGSYIATLTVTDNQGATAVDQASVTVTSGGGTPFTWAGSFGALEPVPGTIPLVITLNLAQDIPQTSGPEALGQYFVDSLKWDPAVLEYHSLTYGSGGGAFNTTDAVGGCKCKLSFSGLPTAPLNAGLVTVATVRFKPKAVAGTVTSTSTYLGPVLSTNQLGAFNYKSLITIVEGTLTVP